jgi:hypothetical protein
MKYTLFSIAFLLFGVILISGCSKDEADKTFTNHLTDNTWTITYYADGGKDETSNFSGYVFEFRSGNILNAAKGGTSNAGTWIVDESSNKLTIDIPDVTNYLDHLNHKWLLIELTNEVIKLRDDSDSGESVYFTRQ